MVSGIRALLQEPERVGSPFRRAMCQNGLRADVDMIGKDDAKDREIYLNGRVQDEHKNRWSDVPTRQSDWEDKGKRVFDSVG
jgi:hypothetical protein